MRIADSGTDLSVAVINTSDLGGEGEPDCGRKGGGAKPFRARTSLLYAYCVPTACLLRAYCMK